MIQERLNKIASLKKQIQEHCMCFEFIETVADYTVIVPRGYSPSGYRVIFSVWTGSKQEALQKLLEQIEAHWKRSFETGE